MNNVTAGHLPSRRESTASSAAAKSDPPRRASSSTPARIGSGICFNGEVSGAEDLVIEGTFEGTVKLEDHSVTVGSAGEVKANVFAKSILVEGTVQGDLHGYSEIIVRPSGKVEGNLFTPRVTLQDGCSFQGSIDMSSSKTKASITEAKVASSAPASKKSASKSEKTQKIPQAQGATA